MGYLALTGKKTAKLAYVLVDTPEFIKEREAKKISYDSGKGGDIDAEVEEMVENYHTYSDIDSKERIKIFAFERDEKAIKAIYDRVAECREFLETLNN